MRFTRNFGGYPLIIRDHASKQFASLNLQHLFNFADRAPFSYLFRDKLRYRLLLLHNRSRKSASFPIIVKKLTATKQRLPIRAYATKTVPYAAGY